MGVKFMLGESVWYCAALGDPKATRARALPRTALARRQLLAGVCGTRGGSGRGVRYMASCRIVRGLRTLVWCWRAVSESAVVSKLARPPGLPFTAASMASSSDGEAVLRRPSVPRETEESYMGASFKPKSSVSSASAARGGR